MDYFLRYASYSLIAGDSTILNERVLNGLDDTYKSLGVPTGPTVRSMVLLADVLCERLLNEGVAQERCALVRQPFEHMASGLAASDVRQR
jgi:phycobilisome core component